jgi:hypothetical protein
MRGSVSRRGCATGILPIGAKIRSRGRESPRSGRQHLAHGEPAVGNLGRELFLEPRQGRHPVKRLTTSTPTNLPDAAATRLTKRVCSVRSHGWLAVGHRIPPLRGWGYDRCPYLSAYGRPARDWSFYICEEAVRVMCPSWGMMGSAACSAERLRSCEFLKFFERFYGTRIFTRSIIVVWDTSPKCK